MQDPKKFTEEQCAAFLVSLAGTLSLMTDPSDFRSAWNRVTAGLDQIIGASALAGETVKPVLENYFRSDREAKN
jgi:hypothetical protein